MDIGIFFFVFVSFFLICVVLLQPGKGDASAIGFGGSSQSIFGSRGAGNFLTKTTAILATLFFVVSFLITKGRLESVKPVPVRQNLPAAAPAIPVVPATPGNAPTAVPAQKADAAKAATGAATSK